MFQRLLLLLLEVSSADPTKSRTCNQGSFCRRYLKFIKNARETGVGLYGASRNIRKIDINRFEISLIHHQLETVYLKLQISFFIDSFKNQPGIVKLKIIDDENPLFPRFEVPRGDVVQEMKIDENVEYAEEDEFVKFRSSQLSVFIYFGRFRIETYRNNKLIHEINSENFLNFEKYRKREDLYTKFVDATFLDPTDLFEEHFRNFVDSKPRGPAAFGIDIRFSNSKLATGLGYHTTDLELQNPEDDPFRQYNTDLFMYELNSKIALYGSINFLVSVGREKYSAGIFWNNPSETFVSIEKKGNNVDTWFLSESGIFEFFLFSGSSLDEVFQQFHSVTGKPGMFPLFGFGKHQSRWNYNSVYDLLEVEKGFDDRNMPVDVFWLDIEHTDRRRYFTWNNQHFSEDQRDRMYQSFEKTSRKLVTIVDPHVAKSPDYWVYQDLQRLNAMTKTADGREFVGHCWPGNSAYPDFFRKDVREAFANFYLHYEVQHFNTTYTWNDMNEPSVFDEMEMTLPRDTIHLENVEHRDLHNLYGFYFHATTVLGHHKRSKLRPFVLTRSFYAGSHRFGPIWTGDNAANFDHLEKSVSMILQLSMSGHSFVGADVGGFFGNPSEDLLIRWHQLGAWYPFYRCHSHIDTRRREPWLYSERAVEMIREGLYSRYRLLPFFYSAFAEWHFHAIPVLRPLWYLFPEDPTSFSNFQNLEFFVSDIFLVRLLKDDSRVDVYLPEKNYYDFWTNIPHPPGHHTVAINNNSKIPVFVKEGSLFLTKNRIRRSSGLQKGDLYTLNCYLDEETQSCSGRVYVDDFDGYDYEKGLYSYLEISITPKGMSSKKVTPLNTESQKSKPPSLEKIVIFGISRVIQVYEYEKELTTTTRVLDTLGDNFLPTNSVEIYANLDLDTDLRFVEKTYEQEL